MKEEYYFEHKDSHICYTSDYFKNLMKESDQQEIEVYEAIRDKPGGGVFWCQHDSFVGWDSAETCGKQCNAYTPRNGKNGRCKYHKTTLFYHGDKVKITLTLTLKDTEN